MSYGRLNLGGSSRKTYTGGRKTTGYSIRDALTCQGVTSEEAMRSHINIITGTIAANPSFDITTYRVNPNNPNNPVPLMG